MPQPLSIAFIWHMHQPYYRDLLTGRCAMPWVRLHATKDYLDMLLRLEAYPSVHQTFNFVPSLLDQLEEYLPPTNRSDDFLDLSRKPAAELSREERQFLLQWFFLANIDRMIRPYPRYHDLLAKRGLQIAEGDWTAILKRCSTQDYLDLQVWFNLAWIDPWLRSQDATLARLVTKGSQFTEEEKRYVLDQHLAMMARVIPAYRAAVARGQIELTTSPYYHPILPLLCDGRSARVALPNLPLPDHPFQHPEDAQWHLAAGLRRHQAAFGAPAAGIWPPEGSVSEEVARLAGQAGLRWMATDEEILWRTLKAPRTPEALYRPHRLHRPTGDLAMVFRDRELSDLIGFVYSQWEPRNAVADFLRRLERIHEHFSAASAPALVSIILDGENAWEYYPDDGHEFLSRLYHALAGDPRFRCVTVSEFLGQYPLQQTISLPELFSGSWIDGNFATWIGHPEKNAAWRHLADAREAFASLRRDDPAFEPAWKSLGVAEGSDWMWWFGDTHFSAQANEFDQLFRTHLTNAYRFARLEPPPALERPIRRQAGLPLYEPTGLIHPCIDGRETSYYEWLYAGRIDLKQQYSAIQRSEQCLRTLYYGRDETQAYLRLDLDRRRLNALAQWSLEFSLSREFRIVLRPTGRPPEGMPLPIEAQLMGREPLALSCALGRTLELAVPLIPLGLSPTEKLQVAVALLEQGAVVERYPTHGTFDLKISLTDFDADAWSV